MKKKCTLLIFIIVGYLSYSQATFNEIIEAGDLPRLKDTIDLLDYDVKKIDGEYDSLLYIACQEEQYNIVEWLLDKNAPIDVEYYFGLTPLAITVRLGNEKSQDC